MAIPSYSEMLLPLLKAISDGKEHKTKECFTRLSKEFGVTENELLFRSEKSKSLIYEGRKQWAATSLKKAGFLNRTRVGEIIITDEGSKFLMDHPSIEALSDRVIISCGDFKEYYMGKPKTNYFTVVPTASGESRKRERAY